MVFLTTWYDQKGSAWMTAPWSLYCQSQYMRKEKAPRRCTSWRSYTLRPCQRQDDYSRRRLWIQSWNGIIRLKAERHPNVRTAAGRWSTGIGWSAIPVRRAEKRCGSRSNGTNTNHAADFTARYRRFWLRSSITASDWSQPCWMAESSPENMRKSTIIR